MKTLYISDLDGTLLNNNAILSENTKNIMNRLISQGMGFSYATARSWSSAHKIMEDIRMQLPVITYNGTFIVEPGKGAIIDACRFDRPMRDYIIDTMLSYKLYPLVYSLVDNEEKIFWIKGKETKGIINYLSMRTGDRRLMGVSSEEALKVGDTFYITLIGAKDELMFLTEIFQDINNYTYSFQSDTYDENEYWYELFPRDASKAKGVDKLMKMTGADRIICFGDNLNDIPMFKASDECYAVSNAKEELISIATGVISSNMEDGVARWLECNARLQ